MKRATLLCLALMLVAAAPARADTFTVNTTADTQVAGGCDTVPACSLRDAITAASAADGNTVMIPGGTYELNTPATLGDLDVNASMTITGAGARSTTIDANRLSRVLNVASAEHTVSISGVTLTGGLSSFLLNPGVTDPFNGDGGAIFTFGALNLTDVTVKGNEAAFGGGGIFAEPFEDILGAPSAPLTLLRTTVSDNKVDNAVPSEGQGGGIASFGSLVLTNSTVHGNQVLSDGVTAGGGIVSSNGFTRLVNSTVTGNSLEPLTGDAGGISFEDIDTGPFDGSLEAINTIIAGNTVAGTEIDCAPADVNVTDNNISGDDTCGFTDPGSKEDTDPQLFALRNNAGPTDTRNFPLTSPALDTGTATGCPGTDQRGQPRPQRGTCDIGAVELAPPSAVTNGASRLSPTSTNVFGTSGNPLIAAGGAAFEFGTTTAYGSKVLSGGTVGTRQSGATSGVAAQSQEAERASLTGLAPNTTYHYRLVVQNADGIAFGADATFLTPSNAAAPRRLRRPNVAAAGLPGGCVRRAFTVRVRASVASGTRLKAVRVTLDGRTLKRSTRRSFTVRVNAAPLRSGRHTLRIKAVDRGNRTRTVTRRFSRCARVPVAEPRFTG